MVGGSEPNAVIRPSVTVGVVDSVLRASVVGLFGTPLLAPLVGRTTLAALAPATVSVPVLTAGLLFAVALALEAGRATLRRYGNEYRIYDERIEVVSGFFEPEATVVPRSAIDQVTLSAGVLQGHVGGGTITVSVGAKHTKYRVRLRDIGDADAWYRTLRPVEDGEPLERFPRSIGPSLLSMLVYLVVGVGFGSLVAALALDSGGRGVSLTVVLLGATLVSYAVSAVYFLYVAGIEYRIYSDHIERTRLFFGSDRSYIVAENIDSVEHVRTVTERLFDVGTISIRVRWRDRPFRLRAIGESEEVYERLRMSA
jgi:uncharacterized membrane protein YdbT with pleckstrin-like domain